MRSTRWVALITVLAALAPSWLGAQNASKASAAPAPVGRTAFNTIYVELGGNGLWYSVNYERMMQSHLAVRGGISYLSIGASSGTASASVSSIGFPLTASYLVGAGSSKLELGGGLLVEKFSGSASSGFGEKAQAGVFYPMGTFVLGYRYSPMGGGFNFKIAMTPVYHPDLGFFPWGGISFGVGF